MGSLNTADRIRYTLARPTGLLSALATFPIDTAIFSDADQEQNNDRM